MSSFRGCRVSVQSPGGGVGLGGPSPEARPCPASGWPAGSWSPGEALWPLQACVPVCVQCEVLSAGLGRVGGARRATAAAGPCGLM